MEQPPAKDESSQTDLSISSSPPPHDSDAVQASVPNDHVSLDQRYFPWNLSQISEMLEVIALAVFIFIAVRGVAQNFIVDGDSMEPGFESNQLLIVNRLAYLSLNFSWIPGVDTEEWQPFGSPMQGDVVVFKYPRDHSRDFIKRIIAKEGQRVQIRDGEVMVNGLILDEPYVKHTAFDDLPEFVVPAGMLYVLGDNRENSFDSRAWGMLPVNLIIGRGYFSYWPLDKIGLVDHHRHTLPVKLQRSTID